MSVVPARRNPTHQTSGERERGIMGIVVVIGGREAVPVRAIPFIAGWMLSPDVVAKTFAKTDHWVTRLDGVAAHYLSADGKYSPMLAKEWDGIEADLKILSDKLKAAEAFDQENYPTWRQQSILRLPASCFVWRDEFEEAFRHSYSPEHLTLLDERPGDRELNLSPRIPEELAEAVMQGFNITQPDNVPGSSVKKTSCTEKRDARHQVNDGMSESTSTLFESLEAALEGWFDKPQEELPDALRHRIETDFAPMPWDSLSPEQRRMGAANWDCQHDPALEDRRTTAWEAYVVGWDYWQKVPSLIAEEFCILRHLHDPRKFKAEKNNIPGGIGMTLGERVSDDMRIIERSLGIDTKKPIKEWVLWTQQQCWDIPLYLRALENEGSTKGATQGETGKPCDVFLAMETLTADEVSIAFVQVKNESGIGASSLLEISAREKTKRVALAALDLENMQSGGLNAQGKILLDMAHGIYPKRSNTNAVKMTRLREMFRKRLGIIDDPFEGYRKGTGWEPRFKIEDKLGALDNRAKREGEHRTDSLEEMGERGIHLADANKTHPSFDSGNDAAADWLRDNDPDNQEESDDSNEPDDSA